MASSAATRSFATADEGARASVAIVDYGLGNLFSVRQACDHTGMRGFLTSTAEEIMSADVVILPGIGAFGDAMEALGRLDLVEPLREVAASGKPLVGICLGLQLLMEESHEFGLHKGLGILQGDVVFFDGPAESGRPLKVPQVGWNRIFRPATEGASPADVWENSPLQGLADGEFMYFVHSFYVRPIDSSLVLSSSRYGDVQFCSSLEAGNIFACQFHPEKSGPEGLRIYRSVASTVKLAREKRNG
jgi:glutamine amidotransferase